MPDNWIQVPFLHLCNTHLQIGDPGASKVSLNRIETTINSHGIEGSVGVRVFGQRNLLTLNVVQTAPGMNLVFEREAKENLVYALNLASGITNQANTATNRLITAWPVGFDVPTPAVPTAGDEVVNRNPYPV